MRIKNIFTGQVIVSSQLVEYSDYFFLQMMETYEWKSVRFPKTAWVKNKCENDCENDFLSLILKDVNKIHKLGFHTIRLYVVTDSDITLELSNDEVVRILEYKKEDDKVLYDSIEINNDDLKASLRAYHKMKRPLVY